MWIEGSVEIDRPIDKVFRFTTHQVADWSTMVAENELIEEKKPDGVGTTFRTITEDGGRRTEFQGVVTRHTPPREHAIHLTSDVFDLDVEYWFEDLSGRTRVTQRSKVIGKGFSGRLLRIVGWVMKKSSHKTLERDLMRLKERCEADTDEPSS